MTETIEFHQILYKKEQETDLFPFAKPFFNTYVDAFFENRVIAMNVPWFQAEKISICSWALRRKMNLRIPPRRDLTEDVLQEDFDVMAFTKNSPSHDMMAFLDRQHDGALPAIKLLWNKLGLHLPSNIIHPIYQNAFCARREVYQDYVAKFLIPAMEVMTADEEMKAALWVDSGYRVTILNVPVDFDMIERHLGVRFVPLHAFVLERCFSAWINDKKLNVKYL